MDSDQTRIGGLPALHNNSHLRRSRNGSNSSSFADITSADWLPGNPYRFRLQPQMSPSSISGIVIVVHLETASNVNGNPVTITAVTFSSSELSKNVNFCGDQQRQFPLNRSVQATFTPGSVCSSLIAVVSL